MEIIRNFFTGGDRVQKAKETIRRLKEKKASRELPSRDERKLEEARRITRRHVIKLIASTCAIPLSAYAAHRLFGEEDSTPKSPPISPSQHIQSTTEPLSPFNPAEAIQYQDNQKKRTTRALGLLREMNEKTRELFKMFQSNAFFSIAKGPRPTERIFIGRQTPESIQEMMEGKSDQFEVVFMPERFSHSMKAPIVWEWQENVLRITDDINSDEWLAIFMFHELSHVSDFHFGNENPKDRKQWLQGEVRAHEFECSLIEAWQPQAYAALIKEGIPLWGKNNRDAIFYLGDKLFPAASDRKRGQAVKNGAILICVAFADAKAKNKDLGETYARILHSK